LQISFRTVRDCIDAGIAKFPAARERGAFITSAKEVDTAQVQRGRIALDTGAYATGRLSAAGISADGVDFIWTGAA